MLGGKVVKGGSVAGCVVVRKHIGGDIGRGVWLLMAVVVAVVRVVVVVVLALVVVDVVAG